MGKEISHELILHPQMVLNISLFQSFRKPTPIPLYNNNTFLPNSLIIYILENIFIGRNQRNRVGSVG